MRVSRSTSLMAGRVKSRTSKVMGRIEGKYRWKKMVLRIPVCGEEMLVFRFCSYREDDSVKRRTDSPFNTSRTLVVSAKISKKYSGGVLRGSILMGAATGATLCMCRVIK